jgi:DNA-binding MarR family transcriptional regulator
MPRKKSSADDIPDLGQRPDKSADSRLELGPLPGLVGYQLRLAQIALFRDFAESLGEFDITPGLFGVLVTIESTPDLKQQELARATQLDRSTVVSVIDGLERRGLVERRAVANDRRSNALRLTADGVTLLKKLKRRVAEHEKRLPLTDDERRTLIELLQKIFPEHR